MATNMSAEKRAPTPTNMGNESPIHHNDAAKRWDASANESHSDYHQRIRKQVQRDQQSQHKPKRRQMAQRYAV
jgi:hypothetical protein